MSWLVGVAVLLAAGMAYAEESSRSDFVVRPPGSLRPALEAIRHGSAGVAVPGIVVARWRADAPLELAAAGCARFDPAGRECVQALTPDALLRVASISKLIVALATTRLAARGALELDEDVSTYLGFQLRNPAHPDVAITLRQLLSHVSSLRDGEIYWVPHPGTLADAFANAEVFDASHPPGSYFAYANLNYGVIATVLERATGLRFDRLMQREVFAPLRVRAAFNWSGLEDLDGAHVATLYRKQDAAGQWHPDGPWVAQVDDFDGHGPQALVAWRDERAPPPTDYVIGTNGTLFAPQGGLRASIRTLVAIVAAALADGSLERMAVPQWRLAADGSNGDDADGLYRAYGLGLQLALPGGTVGHFGDAYGLKGGAIVDRIHGSGWFYLINGTANAPEPGQGAWRGLDKVEIAVLEALAAPRQ